MHPQDRAIPMLPSRSMEQTLNFYRKLGFEGDIVSPTGDYAILELGSLEIHFFLHPELEPQDSSFGCYFRVHDVDALYATFSTANLASTGIPRLTSPEDKPWGMREFALIDEDGSLIRVGQEID